MTVIDLSPDLWNVQEATDIDKMIALLNQFPETVVLSKSKIGNGYVFSMRCSSMTVAALFESFSEEPELEGSTLFSYKIEMRGHHKSLRCSLTMYHQLLSHYFSVVKRALIWARTSQSYERN
jgi:hypothetical protein